MGKTKECWEDDYTILITDYGALKCKLCEKTAKSFKTSDRANIRKHVWACKAAKDAEREARRKAKKFDIRPKTVIDLCLPGDEMALPLPPEVVNKNEVFYCCRFDGCNKKTTRAFDLKRHEDSHIKPMVEVSLPNSLIHAKSNLFFVRQTVSCVDHKVHVNFENKTCSGATCRNLQQPGVN